ncbi:MAG: hypothetical protein KBH23_02585 [Bacteroidaceae bacterium]|nr:hypothetical protein [Bacteroidaceae bacterium]
MKSFFRLFIAIGLLTCFVTACGSSDEPIVSSKGDTTSLDTANTTTLVYMIGENSLTYNTDYNGSNYDYMEYNIQQMLVGIKKAPVGSTWLVYIDKNTEPVLYQIKLRSDGQVERDTVCTYSDQYSTDPNIMSKVIADAYTRFPAEKYGLILSSHGGSWFEGYEIPESLRAKSFGAEWRTEIKSDYYTFTMNIPTIATALANVNAVTGKKLQYILFDSCLMGGIEVAYELKDVTNYFMASAASIWGYGIPYATSMSGLATMDETGLTAAGNAFYSYYSKATCTMSLINEAEIKELALAFKEMLEVPECQSRANSLTCTGLELFEETSAYYFNRDFMQMCDTIAGSSTAGQTALAKIKTTMNQILVKKWNTAYASANTDQVSISSNGISIESNYLIYPIPNFCGLSGYVPSLADYNTVYSKYGYSTAGIKSIYQNHLTFYKTLQWYKDCGWSLSSKFQ